jgi:hypothetical protein
MLGGQTLSGSRLIWRAALVVELLQRIGSVLHSLLCNIVAMPQDEADRFRKQAEECREQAAKAMSPPDKEAWLRGAEEWLKLALSVEERRQG